jgi:hypothetical protein
MSKKPSILEQLDDIANRRTDAPDGTVARIAAEFVDSLGDRAVPVVKEGIASALRGKHERQRADLLLALVKRLQ